MENCDGFFEALGIPYLPSFEAAAVYAVRSSDIADRDYKKWLILCWFDTTFGTYSGARFFLNDSREQMSAFLKESGYNTFEDLLDDPIGEQR